MKVVCVFKWARHPGDAWVNPDGSVVWRGARMVASDDDAAAIVFAREIALSTSGELVGATIGDGDATWALARQAHRAISITGVEPSPDDGATAAALAAAVRHAGQFDLVVMGDAADHPGVAGMLGALLGLPVVAGVRDVALDPDDQGRVLVRRKAGDDLETLVVPTPALVAVVAQTAEKEIPGVRQMIAARKMPVEALDVSAAGLTSEDRVVVVSSRVPQTSLARLFDGDPATAARALIAALRTEGVL